MIFLRPMKPFICLLLFATLVACTPKQEAAEKQEDIEQQVEEDVFEPYYSLERAKADEAPTDTAQFILFDRKGAIPLYPDTAWISEQEEALGEETLTTILDDYSFYEATAMDTLESVGIEILPGGFVGKRYYKFKLSGGSEFVIDLQKLRSEFGVILYNGKDVPVFCKPMEVADVMDSLVNR